MASEMEERLKKLLGAAAKNLPKAEADEKAWLDSTAAARQALDRECEALRAETKTALARYKKQRQQPPKAVVAEFNRRVAALAQRRQAFEQERMDVHFKLELKYGLFDGKEYTDAEIAEIMAQELTPEEFNAMVIDGGLPLRKIS